MNGKKKNGERYLSPRLLQGAGLLLMFGAAAFWAITGHQSALIMGAAMGLIGLGSYAGIHISIRQEIKQQAEEEREQEAQTPHQALLRKSMDHLE